MPAGVILGITVTNPDLLEEYKKIAPATIEAYGGRYIQNANTRADLDIQSGFYSGVRQH